MSALFYECTFREEHFFDIALHAGVNLDKLLSAYAPYIFAVDADIFGADGLYFYGGSRFGRWRGPEDYCKYGGCHGEDGDNDNPQT